MGKDSAVASTAEISHSQRAMASFPGPDDLPGFHLQLTLPWFLFLTPKTTIR